MTHEEKTTESNSRFDGLETMSGMEIIVGINEEDRTVADAVEKVLPQIAHLIEAAATRLADGGRLFYIGAGTSGRLGVLDASECPPTFGVSPEKVIGIIAGGDGALRSSIEGAEDSEENGAADLLAYGLTEQDFVVGLSASGTAAYVLSAMRTARTAGAGTGCVTCNAGAPLAKCVDAPIEVVVGAEFLTGSTRMKAGTAQKMILNMISTAVMIRLGRVRGNKMVEMHLSNQKLIERGARYVAQATGLDLAAAETLLLVHGGVRKAIDAYLGTEG